MTEPQKWTDVMGIADDLAQFARRVEDKLDDMERMQLDNLVLRLDTFVDRLPAALHHPRMHGRRTRHDQEDTPHA